MNCAGCGETPVAEAGDLCGECETWTTAFFRKLLPEPISQDALIRRFMAMKEEYDRVVATNPEWSSYAEGWSDAMSFWDDLDWNDIAF